AERCACRPGRRHRSREHGHCRRPQPGQGSRQPGTSRRGGVMRQEPRTVAGDWYGGTIPENAILEDGAYLETTFSFLHYRSEARVGLEMAHGSHVYLGSMFDVGAEGRVRVGRFACITGVWIICDAAV